MPRVRYWKRRLLHADHSCHSSHSQFCRPGKQETSELQLRTSLSELSQGLPPSCGGSATLLWRGWTPPRQLLLHGVQAYHSERTQSCLVLTVGGSSVLHTRGSPSPMAGLHRSTTSVSPWQLAPLPKACTLISRCLVRLPWQSLEQLDHSDHAANSQSWFVPHPGASQLSYSCGAPGAGSPHQVSCTARLRTRFRVPWPHSAEHELHSFQSPQRPFTQHSG
mmetsp:Transcript_63716/g.134234  ORF Transcript_63716/g.134234 Transcript_63716/m.134234 type:complete len:221 (+) Transcript_63716:616-1278(+)